MYNFFKKNPKREHMTAHKLHGHTWYTFNTALAIPGRRRMAFNKAIREAELGANRNDIKKALELITKHAEKGETTQIIKTVGVLDSYMELAINTKTLFSTTEPVILIDDEPFKELSAEHIALKRQLFNDNPDVYSFFLTTAESFLKDIKVLSKDFNTEDYLNRKEVKATEQVFLNLIESDG